MQKQRKPSKRFAIETVYITDFTTAYLFLCNLLNKWGAVTCWYWKLKFKLPELCRNATEKMDRDAFFVRRDSPSVASCLGVVIVQAMFTQQLETSGSQSLHIRILRNSTSQEHPKAFTTDLTINIFLFLKSYDVPSLRLGLEAPCTFQEVGPRRALRCWWNWWTFYSIGLLTWRFHDIRLAQ